MPIYQIKPKHWKVVVVRRTTRIDSRVIGTRKDALKREGEILRVLDQRKGRTHMLKQIYDAIAELPDGDVVLIYSRTRTLLDRQKK